MSNHNDLTSKAGLNAALSTIRHAYYIVNIPTMLGMHAAKAIGSLFSNSDGKSTLKEQEEAAIAIIKAGKENGAESIEIEVEQQAGIKLEGVFKSEYGNGSVDTVFGKSGKMKLKIKYK